MAAQVEKGKIEPQEQFYLYAKIRTDQSASLLSGIHTSVNRDTLFFLCLNRMQNENQNLFYFSCDPEDYFVNRSEYCRASGATEFSYKPTASSAKGSYRLSYKNNLQHTTGYVENNTFEGLENTFTSPPGAEVTMTPSKELDIPVNNYQGTENDLRMNGKEVNFSFRKNTSQSGPKVTFEPLVRLSNGSPKFIGLNRSYIKVSVSEFTIPTVGNSIQITSATIANKIIFGNGILRDVNNNFFDYIIVPSTRNVNIIKTSLYNSATVGATIDKTGDIYFILDSDYSDSFTDLQTLVGEDYDNLTQYLDFYMLKKKSYTSGGNRYVGFGYNKTTSSDNFYSSASGHLLNPDAYGVLIHKIVTYIDPTCTNSPLNTIASKKTKGVRNNNPQNPCQINGKLGDSMLEMKSGNNLTDQKSRANLGTDETGIHEPVITYSSVDSYMRNGNIYKYSPEEYLYSPMVDYIFLGVIVGGGVILLAIMVVYLVRLLEKDDRDFNRNKQDIRNKVYSKRR